MMDVEVLAFSRGEYPEDRSRRDRLNRVDEDIRRHIIERRSQNEKKKMDIIDQMAVRRVKDSVERNRPLGKITISEAAEKFNLWSTSISKEIRKGYITSGERIGHFCFVDPEEIRMKMVVDKKR
jgi:hypothetical protein